MLLQIVKFESALTEAEARKVAADRMDEYRAIPSLLQKYYLKLAQPNHYAGVMLWETADALAEFRESTLARTVGPSYAVRGAPDVSVSEVMFPLR